MNENQVVVVGAGLAGLSAAWYLREAGRDVLVVDRQQNVALETSFANAGMVTPSMSDPWNAPGIHWKILKWLGRPDAPMLLRPGAISNYLSWGPKFLRHANPNHHRQASAANCALSMYSAGKIRDLRKTLNLEYAASTRGTMKVFRDTRSYEHAARLSEQLTTLGLEYRLLDNKQASEIEPLLAETSDKISGAIHYPRDETGNAWQFCMALKHELLARGVRFRFSTDVQHLRVEHEAVAGLMTANGIIQARQVVIAAASWSPQLLGPLGIQLAVRPVKGYSISINGLEANEMPRMALIDDWLHAAATPMDNILRLAGTAEMAGFNQRIDPARIDNLWRFLQQLSPALHAKIDQAQANHWCGLRPMSADGLPFIGGTSIKGLFLNTGHGHLGWTQSAGSGQMLAQIACDSTPDIDPKPFAPTRRV